MSSSKIEEDEVSKDNLCDGEYHTIKHMPYFGIIKCDICEKSYNIATFRPVSVLYNLNGKSHIKYKFIYRYLGLVQYIGKTEVALSGRKYIYV